MKETEKTHSNSLVFLLLQLFKNCMCMEQLIRNKLYVFHSISLLEAVSKLSGCKCRTRVLNNHTI